MELRHCLILGAARPKSGAVLTPICLGFKLIDITIRKLNRAIATQRLGRQWRKLDARLSGWR